MDPVIVAIAAIAVVVPLLVALVVIGVLWRHAGALDRRLAGLTQGGDGQSLESALRAALDRVDALASRVERLEGRTTRAEEVGRHAIQRTGLVRYNPFDDTGGNQSFALALLDADGHGLVVSSLHARQNTRVYAKTVTGGRSEAALSDEEAEALRLAMSSGAGA